MGYQLSWEKEAYNCKLKFSIFQYISQRKTYVPTYVVITLRKIKKKRKKSDKCNISFLK